MREHISLSKNGYSKMREDTDIVEKTKILYISGTFKEANGFLADVADELNDDGIPILDFCRQGLILETEYAKLRCVHMNSHDLLATRFKNFEYYMVGVEAVKSEFDEKIAFRLKPDAKEIVGRQELLDVLSGKKI